MGKLIGLGVVSLIAAIVGLTVLFGSWYTIDQGERGILLTNGALTDTVGPGLHFKTPWFQSVEKVTLRQQTLTWAGDSALLAYSKDQQTAGLTVVINYRVPESEVANVYVNYGSVDALANKVLVAKAPQEIKTIFGQYNAVGVIADRARFNAEVSAAVQKAADGPLIVDSVQVSNIDFSDAYENAIEARMMAEVEVAKQDQMAKQEKIKADIVATQADGQARSVKAAAEAAAFKVKAEGEANASKIRAEGEATAAAIKAQAEALGANPLLVELTKAKQWNGALPVTMQPNTAIPFLNVGAGQP